MVQLMKALAVARNKIDMNIAYGEAVPRFERLRNAALVGLLLTSLLLGAGYLSLRGQVQDNQRRIDTAVAYFRGEEAAARAEHAQAARERSLILRYLGKSGASTEITR